MAGAENFAAVIDVLEEHVDGAVMRCFRPFSSSGPFLAGQDPRNDIEGDQPFGGFGVAVNRKGDADPAEQQLRFLAAMFQGVRGVPLSQPESSS